MYIFDVETDGLLPEATKIHCLVAIDTDTQLVHKAVGHKEVAELFKEISKQPLAGHNIMGYDIPVVEKVLGLKHEGEVFDTLVASRLIWSNLRELDSRKKIVKPSMYGSHSLDAWGQRLKFYKGDYGKQENAWDEYTPEMLEYCEQDVQLNYRLYQRIIAKQFSQEAMEMEHTMHRLLLQQERIGFPFSVEKAQKLYSTLTARKEEITAELLETMEPTIIEMKTKTKVVPFNPASRQQIADRLIKRGWKPESFTEKGDPKVDEKILSGIDMPEAKLLCEYQMLNKRLGQLGNGSQAWLKLETEGRIHGRVNHMGAVTSRCTHSAPNCAQIPSTNAVYGHECRELFCAPEGYKLLGADASGLELRCLAHYMSRYDDGAYGREILEGDIHTANQIAAGLPDRNTAKTFIYAYLYGGGNEKIGSIIGKDGKEGGRIKQRFLAKTPALKYLSDAVKLKAEKGSIMGLDGRIIPIRHAHAALNTLLQSAGALICKHWYIGIETKIREAGYTEEDVAIVAFVHDEVQIIVREGLEDIIGEFTKQAIKETEAHYKFRCPLDSEFQIGSSWAETH